MSTSGSPCSTSSIGHFPFEKWFTVRDGKTHLAGLQERLPHTIAFIDVGDDGQIRQIEQNVQTKPIPARNLVWHVNEREGNNWAGVSLLRACYTPWVLKHEVLRVHATSHRRWGMGIPVVHAPPGATPGQIEEARRLAAGMRAGDQAGAGLPDGFTFEVAGMTGSTPDAVGFINLLNQEMSGSALTALLELGSTNFGPRALGDTFFDLYTLALQAIADAVGDTVTYGDPAMPGVSRMLTDVNWGEDEPCPRITVGDIGDRHELTATALQQLLAAGAITADPDLEAYIRDAWDLPKKPKSALLPPPPAGPPGQPPAPGQPGVPGPGGGGKTPAGGGSGATQSPPAGPTPAGQPAPAPGRPPARAPAPAAAAWRPDGLRRDLSPVEAAAGLDPVAIRRELDIARDRLLDSWSPVLHGQRADLADQVAAAVDDGRLDRLAHMQAGSADGADLLYAAMRDTCARAAARMLGEAASQGVHINPDRVRLDEDRLWQIARARATMAASYLAAQASRRALQVVTATAGTDAAGMVTATLAGLSPTSLADEMTAALHAANNAGRIAVLDAGPAAVYHASEILDSSTCANCALIDGYQFASLDEARQDYLNGAYVKCLGQLRCRGTVVASWHRADALPPEPYGQEALSGPLGRYLGPASWHDVGLAGAAPEDRDEPWEISPGTWTAGPSLPELDAPGPPPFADGDPAAAVWTERLHPRGRGGKFARTTRPGRAGGNGAAATPEGFSAAFERAFQGSPYSAFVNHYTPAEIKAEHMTPVLAEGGKAGVLIHDHGDGRIEPTALFNTSGSKGAGLALLRRAVAEHHANYVECYGPVLPRLYGTLGFADDETYPFDTSMAAPDWDYKRFDNPDYHIMTLRKPAQVAAAAGGGQEVPGLDLPGLTGAARAEGDPDWWAKYGDEAIAAARVAFGIDPPTASPPKDPAAAAAGDWKEELHPRGPGGKFAHKPGTASRRHAGWLDRYISEEKHPEAVLALARARRALKAGDKARAAQQLREAAYATPKQVNALAYKDLASQIGGPAPAKRNSLLGSPVDDARLLDPSVPRRPGLESTDALARQLRQYARTETDLDARNALAEASAAFVKHDFGRAAEKMRRAGETAAEMDDVHRYWQLAIALEGRQPAIARLTGTRWRFGRTPRRGDRVADSWGGFGTVKQLAADTSGQRWAGVEFDDHRRMIIDLADGSIRETWFQEQENPGQQRAWQRLAYGLIPYPEPAKSPAGDVVAPGVKQLTLPGMPAPAGTTADRVGRSLEKAIKSDDESDSKPGEDIDPDSAEHGYFGNTADTSIVTFADGSKWVRKRRNPNGRYGFSEQNIDREIAYSRVAQVFGVPAPQVIKRDNPDTGEPELWEPYLADAVTAIEWTGGQDPGDEDYDPDLADHDPDDMYYSAEGNMIGLVNRLCTASDRHMGNWMVITDPDGTEHPAPIDNESASFDPGAEAGISAFADGMDLEALGNDHPLSEWDQWQQDLDALRPEFAQLGMNVEHANLMDNFRYLKADAAGY